MTWLNEFQSWLSESQSLQNAQKVVDFLYTDSKDWSKESISALIGNMRHESSINPNMYEYGYDWSQDRGFGLVQWTPRSKFWDWGSAKGYNESQLRSGDAQLDRIDYEVENNIQWIAKDSVFNGLTFKEFRTNSRGLSVDDLTEAFTWGYERPNQQAGEESMPARQAFANRAFNELDWSGSGGTDPDPDPDPEPQPPPIDPKDIQDILDKGKLDLMNSVEIDLQPAIDYIMEEFSKIFNHHVFNISKDYDINAYFKIIHTFKNQMKINPKPKLLDDMIKIIMDGLALIEINVDFDRVFDNIADGIIGLIPEPGPDPDPEPSGDMYFPVKLSDAGINFWKRENWGNGTLQRDMTYGIRSSGAFHAGYDVGSGGNSGHGIYAVRDGIVTHVENRGTAGFVIAIDHSTDDYHTLYMHLVENSNIVNIGDTVKAGQHIATMGATGGNYAIHLHIEVSPSGEFHNEATTINPEPYLKVTADNQTSLPSPK